MRILLLWLAAIMASVCVSGCGSEPGPLKSGTLRDKQAVIYLVRHAEKELAGREMMANDPDLTEAGRARAARLSILLSAEPVIEVWSTNYTRTRDTASPLAVAHELDVQIYDPAVSDQMVAQLRNKKGVVVIIGHSNTIGKLAADISDLPPGPDLNETDYETLYWVTIAKDGHRQMYQSSYEGLERRVTR